MKEPVIIAMIVGISLIGAAFVHGGRYTVVGASQSAGFYVVDRFTGDAYVNGTKLHTQQNN